MSVPLDEDLAFAGPRVVAARVRAREVTATRDRGAVPPRIEMPNPRLNALRVTMADEALAARRRPRPLRESEEAGPLAGVPIAIKDDLQVAGYSMTRGSRSFGLPCNAPIPRSCGACAPRARSRSRSPTCRS